MVRNSGKSISDVMTADVVTVTPDDDIDRVLDLLADLADAYLHLLVGYKGEQPVGLLPLFETRRGPFTELRSPPQSVQVMCQGPLLVRNDGVKQRRAEKDHRRFVDACWEWMGEEVDPGFVELRCVDRYADVRPYLWNGFEATPEYVYIVDVGADRETLRDGLAKETRRQVRNTDEDAYELVEGGVETTRAIAEQVQERYAEQERAYGLTPEFLATVHEQLPDEQVHPYAVEVDGEFVGGLFTLAYGDTMHVWQGGVQTDADLPVNELLYWHAIESAAAMDLDRLDLTTAMVPSLADFKAKFGGEPRTTMTVTWQSQASRATEFGYQALPESGQSVLQTFVS
jgi:hypothetical protein